MTIACNLNAFDDLDRSKYTNLAARVRAALIAGNEIPEGFVFQVSNNGITSQEISDWISMERRCCPFLSIQLSVSTGARRSLTMTGPSGVKQLILAEFPVH